MQGTQLNLFFIIKIDNSVLINLTDNQLNMIYSSQNNANLPSYLFLFSKFLLLVFTC